jgi:rhamnosyl/mannosyltransferase
VLAVGRLTYYKGFDVLIRAIALRPECDLLIVGQGSGLSQLAALADELGVSARVRFLPDADNVKLAALYRTCDVVCLPSIDRSEAFGLVLLEAAYFGAGVIASDIPGSATGPVARSLGGAVFSVGNVVELASRLGEVGRPLEPVVTSEPPIAIDIARMMAVYQIIGA